MELTELGHRQADELAKRIVESGIHIDEILCSPLVRARDTALHVHEITGVPFRVDERLREQDLGIFESTPRDGQSYRDVKINFIDSYGRGESILKLCHRVYGLLDELTEDPSGNDYMLVAHNGIARAVTSYFQDMTNEEYAYFSMPNCEILEFEY